MVRRAASRHCEVTAPCAAPAIKSESPRRGGRSEGVAGCGAARGRSSAGFGAQRYRHRCFLLLRAVSGGRRARSVEGGGAARPLAALVPPRAWRAGRALPTCPESRPVPIPPPPPPSHSLPPPLRRGGPGGSRRRRDSGRFPRGGERPGHDAKRGRRGRTVTPPSHPGGGRWPPARLSGGGGVGGGGQLADICRFWDLRGSDGAGGGGRVGNSV